MKILLDMNLAPRWAQYLQAAGFETLHWSQAGTPAASDQEIMAYAAKFGFIVLTHDQLFHHKQQGPALRPGPPLHL